MDKIEYPAYFKDRELPVYFKCINRSLTLVAKVVPGFYSVEESSIEEDPDNWIRHYEEIKESEFERALNEAQFQLSKHFNINHKTKNHDQKHRTKTVR